jgi:serine/threonine-protein kinase
MRLLEKSPEERYPSASAVLERLQAALRAQTREDPAVLVRGALGASGFGLSSPLAERAGASHAVAASWLASGPRAPIGFVAIAALFALGVVAIEGTSWSARDGRKAGAAPLELAPESAGGLRVVATPWAHVRVDGQHVETTPFARAVPLVAGKHWVTLTHPDAPVVEREVDVAVGETVTPDVTMSVGLDDAGAGKDAR